VWTCRSQLKTFSIVFSGINYTILLSKNNEAARSRRRRRILQTLRKPTTLPTKLAEESEMVSKKMTIKQKVIEVAAGN
jgi:hypothetical protein